MKKKIEVFWGPRQLDEANETKEIFDELPDVELLSVYVGDSLDKMVMLPFIHIVEDSSRYYGIKSIRKYAEALNA